MKYSVCPESCVDVLIFKEKNESACGERAATVSPQRVHVTTPEVFNQVQPVVLPNNVPHSLSAVVGGTVTTSPALQPPDAQNPVPALEVSPIRFIVWMDLHPLKQNDVLMVVTSGNSICVTLLQPTAQNDTPTFVAWGIEMDAAELQPT